MALRIGFARAGSTLPRELSAATQAGMPIEPEDLRRELAIPDSDNAVISYDLAIGEYRHAIPTLQSNFQTAESHVLDGRAGPADVATVKAGLFHLRGGCEEARIAAGEPGLNWNRKWENGFGLEFPEYADLKGIVKALAARAILESEAGQSSAAIDDVESGFQIAHHLGQDPTIIASMVQLSTEGITETALEAVLNGPTTRGDLARAAKIVGNLKDLPNPRFWLGGELVIERQTIRRIHSMNDLQAVIGSDGPPADQDPFLMDWLLRDPSFRKAWEAKAVHYLRTAYAAIPAENPSVSDVRSAMDRIDEETTADRSLESMLNLLPVFSESGTAYARAIARRRMMLVSIAALNAWKTQGSPPMSLPSLGKASMDPFSSKPLGYRRTRTGFRVYSVDADGVDDGGLIRREDLSGSRTHDIAFRFGSERKQPKPATAAPAVPAVDPGD
ncbi:MAG TPA: hypothetical protein VMI31_14735 [Fimbriimonadaceae bacterium]|nr:hypothetical protein [Fimbriimonadaceae bacterium]